MAGKRGRAFEDLRVGKDGGASGVKPGLLQKLFAGGTAGLDLRTGRENLKPRNTQMLFRGGQTADKDLRMLEAGRPSDTQPLADGGEVDDTFAPSSEEKLAAHEVMSAFKSGDAIKLLQALKGLFYLLDDGGAPPADDAGGMPPLE